jgi:hypothetical protein
VLAVVSVVAAVGVMLIASPQKASADQCSVNGRDCYFGYFFNGYDGGPGVRRNNVLRAPALLNVNNATDLSNTLWSHLGGCPGGALWNQNDQNATGAAFIILTMLGAAPGTPKNVACQRFAEWRDTYLFPYEAAGLINFNMVYNFGGINTRSTGTDVAYYPNNGAAPSIVFFDPDTRLPLYAVKKDCGNPVGVLRALRLDFNLQPQIQAFVNGAPSATLQAEAGDTISFSYGMNNTGHTRSSVVNCSGGKIDRAGFHGPQTPAEGGGVPLILVCPAAFNPGNNYAGGPETSFTAVGNTSYCRTLFVSPATQAGGTNSYELCVNVVQKPYLKVYGGDVSVGGALDSGAGSCSLNSGAVSWNQKTAGHPGAGTQFGAFVNGLIREFATAQGNAGGAPAGAGLSFANTVNNPPVGEYGGNFGSASCIKDYYDYSGGAPDLPPNVSSMNTAIPVYAHTGNVSLGGGNVNPNQRTTVYIDGDLYITGNIDYVGGWNIGSMPMLKFVVRGNIYVGNGVANLDGIYIAQQKTGVPASGSIYTCTTSAAPPSVANGAFFAGCQTKLTVNGAFIANSVEFLRVRGSQKASTASEASTSNNIAEVFNFSPAFWIPQPAPTDGGGVENYDSIISLPPVL